MGLVSLRPNARQTALQFVYNFSVGAVGPELLTLLFECVALGCGALSFGRRMVGALALGDELGLVLAQQCRCLAKRLADLLDLKLPYRGTTINVAAMASANG